MLPALNRTLSPALQFCNAGGERARPRALRRSKSRTPFLGLSSLRTQQPFSCSSDASAKTSQRQQERIVQRPGTGALLFCYPGVKRELRERGGGGLGFLELFLPGAGEPG